MACKRFTGSNPVVSIFKDYDMICLLCVFACVFCLYKSADLLFDGMRYADHTEPWYDGFDIEMRKSKRAFIGSLICAILGILFFGLALYSLTLVV